MHRRTLFAMPLLAALPLRLERSAWRDSVSELRFGITCTTAFCRAENIDRVLRMRLHPIALPTDALIEAVMAGQVEIAACTRPQADAIQARMGDRALRLHGNTILLRSLPETMLNDIAEALLIA